MVLTPQLDLILLKPAIWIIAIFTRIIVISQSYLLQTITLMTLTLNKTCFVLQYLYNAGNRDVTLNFNHKAALIYCSTFQKIFTHNKSFYLYNHNVKDLFFKFILHCLFYFWKSVMTLSRAVSQSLFMHGWIILSHALAIHTAFMRSAWRKYGVITVYAMLLFLESEIQTLQYGSDCSSYEY